MCCDLCTDCFKTKFSCLERSHLPYNKKEPCRKGQDSAHTRPSYKQHSLMCQLFFTKRSVGCVTVPSMVLHAFSSSLPEELSCKKHCYNTYHAYVYESITMEKWGERRQFGRFLQRTEKNATSKHARLPPFCVRSRDTAPKHMWASVPVL